MATKDVLKHGNNYVSEINDADSSDFEAYETYSRKKLDEKFLRIRDVCYDWAGKTIIVEGDSVSHYGVTDYLQDALGCTAILHGISGEPVYSDTDGLERDFRKRISAYSPEADAIIIIGDVNHTGMVTGSSTLQGTIWSDDITSWFGKYNTALQGLKKSYPTVPIFLVAEFGMSESKQKTTYNVATYYQQLARRWSCIYIDLTTECSLDLRYASSVWGNTVNDSVHPSVDAMKLAMEVIVRKLKQIPPFEFTGEDSISFESEVTVTVGETVDLTVTKTGDLSTQWKSDDTTIATVLGGKVWGMAAGTAIITATTRNGNTATCTVTVKEATE